MVIFNKGHIIFDFDQIFNLYFRAFYSNFNYKTQREHMWGMESFG